MVDGIRYDAGGAVIDTLLAAQIKNDVATVHGIEMRPSDIARQTIYDIRDVYTGSVALLGGEYVASDKAYMYPADTMQAFFDGIEPDSGAVILDALEEGERQKHSLLFIQGGPRKFTQP